MKLTEAIDLFPTLRGTRAGVDQDDRRSWFYDENAFMDAAVPHGSGAVQCAAFILSCAGHQTRGFVLQYLFDKIDTAHKAAALELFAACIRNGGLK